MDSSVIQEDGVYRLWGSRSYRDKVSVHEENEDFQRRIETDDVKRNDFERASCSEELRYYSVCSLFGSSDNISGQSLIFTDKAEALNYLKEDKSARLKSFLNYDEALDFSLSGESLFSNKSFPVGEQMQWKTPKSQDLVKFRKAILSKRFHIVQQTVKENPRYLVGSGDTPTILHGGCRYNALHVAVMSCSSEICSYILSVISNVGFIERLYGPNESNALRTDILLDLFLNMPDKGLHETPLHFASKLGALDVVNVLVGFQQCDKSRKNKEGRTPLEIACNRAPKYLMHNKNEIIDVLGEHFFVPLYRTVGNVIQPSVGEPCTPENPPNSIQNNLTPPQEVKAIAGPMTAEEAQKFRKKWKTPPRKLKDLSSNRPELLDPDKGMEQLGRKLADEFRVGWKEYWSFLDSFVDLTSAEGLDSLEKHLKKVSQGKFDNIIPESMLFENSDLSIENTDGIEILSGLSFDSSDCEVDYNKTLKFIVEKLLNGRGAPENKNGLKQAELRNNYEFLTPKKSSSHYGCNNKRFNFSPLTVESICEIFANRITYGLLRGGTEALSEVALLQLFLSGCKEDHRFQGIDLTKIHYTLSVSIKKKLIESSSSSVQASTCELFKDHNQFPHDNGRITLDGLKRAFNCISQNVIALFTAHNHNENTENAIDNKKLWLEAKSCDCELFSSNTEKRVYVGSLCRRLSFSDDDESGSEDTFYTARNSSTLGDDNSDPGLEEESIIDESGLVEVFLSGPNPTKLDKAALEAIESIPVSPLEYPYITLWRLSCARRFALGTPDNSFLENSENRIKYS